MNSSQRTFLLILVSFWKGTLLTAYYNDDDNMPDIPEYESKVALAHAHLRRSRPWFLVLVPWAGASTVPHSRGIWHKRLACLIVDWKQRQGESKFKTILGCMSQKPNKTKQKPSKGSADEVPALQVWGPGF